MGTKLIHESLALFPCGLGVIAANVPGDAVEVFDRWDRPSNVKSATTKRGMLPTYKPFRFFSFTCLVASATPPVAIAP